MNKSRKLRASVGKNTTRKNAIRKITFSSDYVLEDSEKDIPLNVYTPIRLPVPKEKITKEQLDADVMWCWFDVSQTDTHDTFSVSVKYMLYQNEINVKLPENDFISITIQKQDFYDTNSIVEAFINVKYREQCNKLHNHKENRVRIRTAISFALKYFNIDKIYLKDMGQIKYTDIFQTSLPVLYEVKYIGMFYQ